MVQEESTRIHAAVPRSIGGVLDDAIRLYRRSFSGLWPLTLAAAALIAIPGVFLGIQMAHVRALGPQAALAMMKLPGYWLSYAVMSLVYLVIHGALLSALNRFATRGELSIEDALGVGVRRLPSMVAVGFLLFLCIMVGVSRRLIKGHWWRSVTIVTVGIVIVSVFSLLAGVVNGVVVAVFRVDPIAVFVVQPVIGAVINVFMLSLLPSVLLCMYYDLKLRNEGQDLAARVGALAAQ